MRLFAALWPPEEVRSWLADAAARLTHDLPAGSRIVSAANLHATLAFYGDRDDPAELKHGLEPFSEGLEVTPGGSGTFPSPTRARVVWIGLQAPGFAALCARAASVGELDPASGQTPHVTVARLKRPFSLAGLPDVPAGPSARWSVRLVRSHLGPRGARYEIL